MLDIHFETAEKVLVKFIRESVYKNNFQKGILGVSGGIDSAVALVLTQRALGSENTYGLLMPYKFSSGASLTDGEKICKQLNVSYETIDISPSVDAYFDRYPAENKMLIGNKCARERMSVLYDFSARKNALVVGTSNKSELLIGYSTLFGDSAAAFLPIGDLYKTQVFAFAEYLGVPEEILVKKPSADLWANQTDEGEIGLTYNQLDEILFQMVDGRKNDEEIVNAGYPQKDIDKIRKMMISTQYKRTMAPIAKVHPRTVGLDFRYLRDWNK